jgi:hypothetical protein
VSGAAITAVGKFAFIGPDYGVYEPYGAYSFYGPYGYAREPWRDRWGHEHEREHWGRYEREREYEDED